MASISHVKLKSVTTHHTENNQHHVRVHKGKSRLRKPEPPAWGGGGADGPKDELGARQANCKAI